MSELKELTFVSEVKARHVPLLREIAGTFWDGTDAVALLEGRNGGRYHFFETLNGSALVITEPQDLPRGRELFIVGVAGCGILPKAEHLIEDLKVIAKAFNCRQISCFGVPKGWGHYAERFGFRAAATVYLMDLEMEDGR